MYLIHAVHSVPRFLHQFTHPSMKYDMALNHILHQKPLFIRRCFVFIRFFSFAFFIAVILFHFEQIACQLNVYSDCALFRSQILMSLLIHWWWPRQRLTTLVYYALVLLCTSRLLLGSYWRFYSDVCCYFTVRLSDLTKTQSENLRHEMWIIYLVYFAVHGCCFQRKCEHFQC